MLSTYKTNSAIIGAVLLACPIQSKAITGIVPGHSLGKITIGELRESVLATFPSRPTGNYDLKHGLVEDEWMTKASNKDGIDYSVGISIWYRQGKVIQIEYFNQSTDKPQLSSFNTIVSSDKNIKKVNYKMGCYNQSGEWAGAYELVYYDDIKKGIAYGLGVQDDYILTMKPEYIAIHAPGTPVLPTRGLTNATAVVAGTAIGYRNEADFQQAEMAKIKRIK